MSTMLVPRGIRKSSNVITIAAAATAENLFLRSANMSVGRSVIVRKIFGYTNVGNVLIQIGTGLAGAWAALFPPILVPNTFDIQLEENEIPEIEVFEDITCQADILGCMIMIEVEEVGSS